MLMQVIIKLVCQIQKILHKCLRDIVEISFKESSLMYLFRPTFKEKEKDKMIKIIGRWIICKFKTQKNYNLEL